MSEIGKELRQDLPSLLYVQQGEHGFAYNCFSLSKEQCKGKDDWWKRISLGVRSEVDEQTRCNAFAELVDIQGEYKLRIWEFFWDRNQYKLERKRTGCQCQCVLLEKKSIFMVHHGHVFFRKPFTFPDDLVGNSWWLMSQLFGLKWGKRSASGGRWLVFLEVGIWREWRTRLGVVECYITLY